MILQVDRNYTQHQPQWTHQDQALGPQQILAMLSGQATKNGTEQLVVGMA